MAEGEWEIQEVRMMGSSLVLRVPSVPTLKPLAGQYFQVFAPEFPEPAATSLFPVSSNPDSWDLTGTIPPNWNPGNRLRWRGPLGHGFDLSAKVGKAAFIPWLDSGLILLPLVHQALRQQAAISWYSSQVPDWLPPQVEVLPPESVSEAMGWAEYIAVTCEMKHLTGLISELGLKSGGHLKCKAEVLVRTPLICGAIGECGVCSVKTRRGWKRACADGPVFDLEELEA